MKLKDLKAFIKGVEKKYGKKAETFEVEVHRPFLIEGEKGEFWAPHELSFMGVAKYDEDKKPTVIFR